MKRISIMFVVVVPFFTFAACDEGPPATRPPSRTAAAVSSTSDPSSEDTPKVSGLPGESTATSVKPIHPHRWPLHHWRAQPQDPTRVLAEALPTADDWKTMEGVARQRAMADTALSLGMLAQSGFSDEPQEARRGRLRGLALQAALPAYKELNSIPWDCKPAVCPDRSDYLYAQALLMEQASDREGAIETYKQVMEKTTDALTIAKCHVGIAAVAESTRNPSQQPLALKELQDALNILLCSPGPGEKDRPKVCMPDENLQQSILNHLETAHPKRFAEVEKWMSDRADRETRRAADDAVWAPVQEAGDDLATKAFLADLARSLSPQMTAPKRIQNERAIKRMQAHREMIMKDTYCPAKKAFVAKMGAAAFNKRAAEHCKIDPPTASGRAGEQVTLTSQCQAAYASPCPLPTSKKSSSPVHGNDPQPTPRVGVGLVPSL